MEMVIHMQWNEIDARKGNSRMKKVWLTCGEGENCLLMPVALLRWRCLVDGCGGSGGPGNVGKGVSLSHRYQGGSGGGRR